MDNGTQAMDIKAYTTQIKSQTCMPMMALSQQEAAHARLHLMLTLLSCMVQRLVWKLHMQADGPYRECVHGLGKMEVLFKPRGGHERGSLCRGLYRAMPFVGTPALSLDASPGPFAMPPRPWLAHVSVVSCVETWGMPLGLL